MKWVFSGRKDNNYNSGRIHAGFFFLEEKDTILGEKDTSSNFYI